MKKLQKNKLEFQTINNDIQAKMQTISTVLDDIQSDMGKMRVRVARCPVFDWTVRFFGNLSVKNGDQTGQEIVRFLADR